MPQLHIPRRQPRRSPYAFMEGFRPSSTGPFRVASGSGRVEDNPDSPADSNGVRLLT
jgi:hypothetical protein